MTHQKDIPLSDVESIADKMSQATTPSADDALSMSSEATLAERHSSLSLFTIAGLAASVPASSLTILSLTLLGHLLFAIGSVHDAPIRSIPVSSSIAAGAVGGAIWGAACVAVIVILYVLCSSEWYAALCRLGTILAIASVVIAPPIGAAVMKGVFHGNILNPFTAMCASIIGTLTVCCVTLCLLSLVVVVAGV